jgi:hypothetical protein
VEGSIGVEGTGVLGGVSEGGESGGSGGRGGVGDGIGETWSRIG